MSFFPANNYANTSDTAYSLKQFGTTTMGDDPFYTKVTATANYTKVGRLEAIGAVTTTVTSKVGDIILVFGGAQSRNSSHTKLTCSGCSEIYHNIYLYATSSSLGFYIHVYAGKATSTSHTVKITADTDSETPFTNPIAEIYAAGRVYLS